MAREQLLKIIWHYYLFFGAKITALWEIVPAVSGDRFLSMLPPWHAYERASEYFIFTHGIENVYTTVKNLRVHSLFPIGPELLVFLTWNTNSPIFLFEDFNWLLLWLQDDLRRYQPHYVVSVPLVFEILYR